MSKESPHDRFVRLASKRTNTVLEKIRVLGNCSNTAVYEYTEEEIKKMFAVIESELRTARSKFKTSNKKSFQL